MSSQASRSTLKAHIGLAQGVALYVSAILGAGVLVLPGQVASLAGPASLVSWGFACLLSVPLAFMFVALARTLPGAGGVATFAEHAFGPRAGGICGWMYFVAGSVGQTIVPLTGGYYVAEALSWGRGGAFAVAVAILLAAVAANLAGRKVSARVQLVLAATVAAVLALTVLVAIPSMEASRLSPFAPHGLGAVASGGIILFFAFAGWEAVVHLSGEFRSPHQDVARATVITLFAITLLYLGTAVAVVMTGRYGTPEVDHVSIGLLLEGALGGSALGAAAVLAVIISLGTTNAFIAGVSRLALTLADSGWLPAPVARVSRESVPVGGVLAVGGIAVAGLGVAWSQGWGTEQLVVVPSTLVVTVYLFAAAAGLRLLRGKSRGFAATTLVMSGLVVPSASKHLFIPAVVAVIALLARSAFRHGGVRRPPQHDVRAAEP